MNIGKHLSDYKIKKIIEAFCADISAIQTFILSKTVYITANKKLYEAFNA